MKRLAVFIIALGITMFAASWLFNDAATAFAHAYFTWDLYR